MSKVMPLPTSTTVGVAAPARGRRVVETDQPGRRGRGLADADDPAEALVGELPLVPDGDVEAVLGGERRGPARPATRGSSGSRDGRQHPRAPARAAEPRRRGPGSSPRASASGRPASTTRRTGRCSGGVERQWKANEPSIAPTTNASRPRRPARAPAIVVATDVPVAGGAGQCRAGAAEVLGALLARRRRAAPGAGRRSPARRAAPGSGRDLAGPTGGPGELEQREQVDAERSATSAAPGPSRGPGRRRPRPGSTGSASTSTPREGVRGAGR